MITVDRDKLLAVLERCEKVAPPKSPYPLMSHVAFDCDGFALTYRVTDGRLSIRGALEASGEPASFTANARELPRVLQGLGDSKVKLKPKPGTLEVSGEGRRVFRVKTLDAADFPHSIESDGAPAVLPAATLRELIAAVAWGVAPDRDDREYLKGVHLDAVGGVICATVTDGHRAARMTSLYDGPAFELLLPAQAVRLLSLALTSAETVTVRNSPACMSFEVGSEVITALPLAGQFPLMSPAFADERRYVVELDGPALVEAISAIRRADSGDVDVVVTLGESGIQIEASGEGYGSDEISAKCPGPGQFAVSSAYLLEALKAAGQTITLGYDGELDPVVIRGGDWHGVLMPRRLEVVRGKGKAA